MVRMCVHSLYIPNTISSISAATFYSVAYVRTQTLHPKIAYVRTQTLHPKYNLHHISRNFLQCIVCAYTVEVSTQYSGLCDVCVCVCVCACVCVCVCARARARPRVSVWRAPRALLVKCLLARVINKNKKQLQKQ